MAITVKRLVETPHLRTRFFSGRAGGEQAIHWAHSCEMPDPWNWLEPFDMLMTTGLGVPSSPDKQARYVGLLADAGISAIAVAKDAGAPPISEAMAICSERRALPILLTEFEVPFAALARVVADSRTDLEERRRLLKTARIYEILRTATIQGHASASLVSDLGAELGCQLEVVDTTAWRCAFAADRSPPTAVSRLLGETLVRGAGHLPAILRLDVEGSAGLAVPVPSRRPAALISSDFTDSVPELSVLQHAATVMALEMEKLFSERGALIRAGGELLAALVSAALDGADAAARLRTAGMPRGQLIMAAWREGEPATEHAGSATRPGASVGQDLLAYGVPHLLQDEDRDAIALALMPGDSRCVETLLRVLPDVCTVGLSGPLEQPERIPNAAREARWALHSAGRDRAGASHYGAVTSSLTFPLERSEELAEHVLGSLMRYDRQHQTELVRTLAVLLRYNRSSTRSAAELFIHRQTLVYRMRRIEALTGRSLSVTKDVVDLWLALRAVEIVHGHDLLGDDS